MIFGCSWAYTLGVWVLLGASGCIHMISGCIHTISGCFWMHTHDFQVLSRFLSTFSIISQWFMVIENTLKGLFYLLLYLLFYLLFYSRQICYGFFEDF